MEELPFKPLLEVKQAICDITYILDNAPSDYTDMDDAIAILEIAYRKAISNREINQANSHFDRRMAFDKDMIRQEQGLMYNNVEGETNGEIG